MNRLKTLLLCPVLWSTPLAAQQIPHPGSRTGPYLSPNVGFSTSDVVHNNFAGFYGLASRADLGLNVGVDAGYSFNDHLGLGIGIGYERYSYTSYSTSVRISNRVVQSFVSVPVYVHILTSRFGRIGFFANVGFAYHIGTGVRYPDQQINYYTETVGYTRNNVSLQLFAGIHLPAGNRLSLDLGPDGQYFVTDNFNSTQSRLSGHLAALGGKAALNIRLAK